jgi:hypothetical protein
VEYVVFALKTNGPKTGGGSLKHIGGSGAEAHNNGVSNVAEDVQKTRVVC